MSREIKFRAWDLEDKRMIIHEQEFIPLKVTNFGVFRLSAVHGSDFWQMMPPSRFVLMQYTGLKDKNGVEIYEGDIVYMVKYKFGKGKSEVWTVEYMAEGSAAFCAYNQLNSCRVMEEALHQDSLEFGGVGSFSPDGLGLAICEVIGNIHENPELLESAS